MLIIINKTILKKMFKLSKKNVEYFGKMVCALKEDNYYITKSTFPKKDDILTATTFKEASPHHKNTIIKWSKNNNENFIGTWHSHRFFSTRPSHIDINSFKKNFKCSLYDYSINIIVSVNSISFYIIDNKNMYYYDMSKKDSLKNKELKIHLKDIKKNIFK